jgi:hypothetical protein
MSSVSLGEMRHSTLKKAMTAIAQYLPVHSAQSSYHMGYKTPLMLKRCR